MVYIVVSVVTLCCYRGRLWVLQIIAERLSVPVGFPYRKGCGHPIAVSNMMDLHMDTAIAIFFEVVGYVLKVLKD
jgi:hypothetical protein